MSHVAPVSHAARPPAPPAGRPRRRWVIYLIPLLVVLVAAAMAGFGQIGGGAPNDVWRFLGRFHPMVLHVPIGAVAFLAFAEVASLATRRRVAVPRVTLLAFIVLGALVTVAAGFALGQDTGYGRRLLNGHFLWGVGFLAAAAVGLAVALAGRAGMRGWRGPAYALSLAAMLITLTVAGHLGASLTHGETYLTQYAPAKVRPWMERAFRMEATPDTSRAASPEAAVKPTVYASRVAPILAARCYQCHDPARQRGGLRVDSLAALLAGGELGPAIVPGKPDESNLVRYLELPADHDDHMPPAGKPQPTPDDVALLRAWVANGASDTLAAADAPWLATSGTATETATSDAASTSDQPERETDAAVPDPAALTEAVARVNDALGGGRPLGYVSRGSTDLQFAAQALVGRLTADHLRQLAPAAAQIVEMDLSFAPLDDAMLEALPPMPRLRRLNLAGTPVDDLQLALLLRKAPALERLLAYQTKVTDASLPALAAHPTLRNAVVSLSAVTPAAADAARRARPDLEIVTGQ